MITVSLQKTRNWRVPISLIINFKHKTVKEIVTKQIPYSKRRENKMTLEYIDKKDLERLHILVGELRARQMSSGIVVIPKPDQGGLQFKFDVAGEEADACRALAQEMDMVEVGGNKK